jgi:hypothetical protein
LGNLPPQSRDEKNVRRGKTEREKMLKKNEEGRKKKRNCKIEGCNWGRMKAKSSVVHPKLFFPDPDPTLTLISDPDPDPACL